MKSTIPDHIEDHRDERWCREATRQVETAPDAERFIEDPVRGVLTDSRALGASTRGLGHSTSVAS